MQSDIDSIIITVLLLPAIYEGTHSKNNDTYGETMLLFAFRLRVTMLKLMWLTDW